MENSKTPKTPQSHASEPAETPWSRIEPIWRSSLDLVGPDRVRFLNGLVTCDVRDLPVGTGTYGYFTSLKGRILADVFIFSLADRFRLDLPAQARSDIADHLGKYLLADRVEVEPSDMGWWRVLGSDAASGLGELFGSIPEAPWQGSQSQEGSWIARRGRPGSPAFDLWGITAADLAALDDAGCGVLDADAFEALRIEEGRPRWGVDFGLETLPQEVGEEGAVSYEKGCFLGQEVVARIHYRGGVQKHLCGVLLSNGPIDSETGSLLLEGREVGRITSAAFSTGLGRWIGLATAHDRATESGMALEIEGGGQAQICDLPFI